jgi:hypothetical protein
LPFYEVVISLSKISFIGSSTETPSLVDFDLRGFRIYNRHLQNLRQPDDRDNPRVEFVTELIPGEILVQGAFQQGRQNLLVEGVFGYTEFDGSHIGRKPRRLARAAQILTLRRALDPFGADPFISQPGRIKEAKTRDQSVKFGGASDAGIGALTGDRIVDDILIPYMRPPYFVAVPDVNRSVDRRERTVRVTGISD